MSRLVMFFAAILPLVGLSQQTLLATIGDQIDLSIDNARGQLNWQESNNNSEWSDISAATSGAHLFTITTLPTYLRLKMEEGTCNMHFSEVLTVNAASTAPRILMFVSYEQTYYSEYKVMREALIARGYQVEVRSSAAGTASIYTLSGDLNDANNSVSGSTYSVFAAAFQDLTGSAWNGAWNATPGLVDIDGRIQDVPNMDSYEALVVVGGTGALDYRVDGSYSAQSGNDGRNVSAANVQSAAEKLNELALDALGQDKPVLAQCHGASLPAFWRIPGTSGAGAETMGYSILKGGQATGYPDETDYLTTLDITPRVLDKVTVSNPHALVTNGLNRIITSRDWYVQTVLHAAGTLMNIIETYETPEEQISILILHGGAVDQGNCGGGNKANDIPCNSGSGQMPADFTDVEALLEADSPNDDFQFVVSDVNLTGSPPFDANNQSDIETYLNQYDVVYFYKHWSTGVTVALENALVSYADDGGGVVSNHHGMYNDIDGANNKDILANQLFGIQSAQAGWGQNLTTYDLFMTNYGHFITTYGVSLSDAKLNPVAWNTQPLRNGGNPSHSYYQTVEIWDEFYTNMAFVGTPSFGRGVNQITPLLSNNQTGIAHTSGIARLFDPSGDESVGRVVYFQPGDIKSNTNIAHPFGQMIRNAVVWASSGGVN